MVRIRLYDWLPVPFAVLAVVGVVVPIFQPGSGVLSQENVVPSAQILGIVAIATTIVSLVVATRKKSFGWIHYVNAALLAVIVIYMVWLVFVFLVA